METLLLIKIFTSVIELNPQNTDENPPNGLAFSLARTSSLQEEDENPPKDLASPSARESGTKRNMRILQVNNHSCIRLQYSRDG
ncbi:hypothetical protein JTB14_013600 [Gonioctena quinquepunctata]|nr:hypothetical protein JTB14_013600 [Gonioctena quinquepunctata]